MQDEKRTVVLPGEIEANWALYRRALYARDTRLEWNALRGLSLVLCAIASFAVLVLGDAPGGLTTESTGFVILGLSVIAVGVVAAFWWLWLGGGKVLSQVATAAILNDARAPLLKEAMVERSRLCGLPIAEAEPVDARARLRLVPSAEDSTEIAPKDLEGHSAVSVSPDRVRARLAQLEVSFHELGPLGQVPSEASLLALHPEAAREEIEAVLLDDKALREMPGAATRARGPSRQPT